MDNRQAIGSWLSGPRAAAEGMGIDFGYRGERLGLPREGPGSIAPVGRRLAAICVDWLLCALIAYGLLAQGNLATANNWTLAVFTLMSLMTVGTVGMTPGKRLLGLRVVHLSGERLSFPRSALRCLLLALAIPALIWDRDGRGLHDRAAAAVQVRLTGQPAADEPPATAGAA
ncbi:RDD family protein [Streptomyces sedi]|uniref:RDD family protein n=1 Tax=Streptomyces sedi TaxID=555059 RepID=A0A5C4V6M2_9ACTN|nr:RDD family protein [Streptomyces sedi]TNM31106.1 RDD family protein [Streptomyces sedi]